jgi:hypothetical protein
MGAFPGQGTLTQGKARFTQGKARQGKARQGKARQGKGREEASGKAKGTARTKAKCKRQKAKIGDAPLRGAAFGASLGAARWNTLLSLFSADL